MNQERSVRFAGKLRQVGVGLGALGALAALAGAVALRGAPQGDPNPRTPSEPSPSASMAGAPSASSATLPARPAHAGPARASAMRPARAASRVATAQAVRRPSEERARLVETAQRELALLEVQEPANFLALFDLMREDAPDHDKALEAGRAASHAYILARMRILEGMLRRFIDNPDGDRTLETDVLARVDADFKQTIDSLARDVPSMASVQEILTTTMLKAPAFTDLSPEEK